MENVEDYIDDGFASSLPILFCLRSLKKKKYDAQL